MTSIVTTILDVVGVALLAAFAWFWWPPLALLVVGLALLTASYVAQQRRGPDREEQPT